MTIKINPKNKGKFNALKKRTGKSTEELTHSKNPLTRKRAIFAQNAKKWNHEEGGFLFPQYIDGSYLPQYGGLTTDTQFLNPNGFARGITPNVAKIGSGIGAGTIGMAGELGVGLVDAFATPDQYTEEGMVDINEGAAAAKGALSGATAGLALGPLGAVGGAIIGGLGSFFGASNKQKTMNAQIGNQRKIAQFNSDVNNRLSTMEQNKSYTTVAKQGGFTVYKGETHKGPNGGILTDEQGNPSGLSNNPSIALTENNEVARYDPDTSSTYIYSNALGFAKPATNMVNKYKLDKDNSEYKYNPLLKIAVDKQFDNLTTAQEFAKETKTDFKNTMNILPKAGKGGYLSVGKAKEMLKDGTAHGKKLTAKQKRYFGYIAGGGKPQKEFGGELPIYEEPNPTGYLPNENDKHSLAPIEFIFDPIHALFNSDYPDYTQEDMQIPKSGFSIRNTRINNMGTAMIPFYAPKQGKPQNSQPLTIYKGKPIQGPKTDIKLPDNTIKARYAPPTHGEFDNLTFKSFYKKPIQVDKDGRTLSGLAKGPIIPQQQEENYSPTLSPLGHIASALGNLADYRALNKAKPTDVNLPRVGAERISLAKQRLANERNAATARAINTTSARGLGLNAGATMANTTVANTGVNRLLGQQNADSLMTEENTNAQLRQQANMMNAELGAQEGLFNTQQQNAFRMAKARLNPLGNLARTVASYAANNASYSKGYDVARMLSPDADIYRDSEANWFNWLTQNKGPAVSVADKTLYQRPVKLNKRK